MSQPAATSSDSEDDNICQTPPSPASPAIRSVNELPLHSIVDDFRSVLDEFRNNWQRELKNQDERGTATEEVDLRQQVVQPDDTDADDLLTPLASDNSITEAEQQALAETLYRTAAELEQRGKVYDALPFYRKAVQIVPDIEFKFYECQKITAAKNVEANSTFVNHQAPLHDDTFDAEEQIEDLYEKFQMDLAHDYGGRLLLSNCDAGIIATDAHISDLPPEILLYILRWVVSAQLDLRSLEQCAAVCKGLYLCARDEELWRLACSKVWGINLGTLTDRVEPATDEGDLPELSPAPIYTSWRHMFIERERVLFNGCYISKTTYLRLGENNFQDQYYRAMQLVEYFRYVRFLADGTVFMMTTADEPSKGVIKLKQLQQARPEVMRGHYRLYGSTVSILLQKQKHQQKRFISGGTQHYARQRRANAPFDEDFVSTKYCIKFHIVSTPKRKFSKLLWKHYSVAQTRNKVETTSEFDLTPSKYPPLWFSPVRSFHMDADAPLA